MPIIGGDKMDKLELRDIKKDIFKTKLLTLEQNLYFFKYYIDAYINIHFTFGHDSVVIVDLQNVYDEYRCVVEEEKLLMKLLIKYSEKIDYQEADYLLATLDNMNEKIMLHYYDYFDNVDYGCDIRDEFRATRWGRRVETIADTDEYRKMFVGLLLKEKDIKTFLGYSDDFWKFMEGKIKYLEIDDDDLYGFDNGILYLPNVVNLETATINIELLEEAYSKYFNCEESNKLEEFNNDYIPKKLKKIFKNR